MGFEESQTGFLLNPSERLHPRNFSAVIPGGNKPVLVATFQQLITRPIIFFRKSDRSQKIQDTEICPKNTLKSPNSQNPPTWLFSTQVVLAPFFPQKTTGLRINRYRTGQKWL